MRLPRLGWLGVTALSFFSFWLGVILCAYAPSLVLVLPGGFTDKQEIARVTSPNGLFDAVMIRNTYGGAAGGGIDSYVYIVPKGKNISSPKEFRHVFLAAKLDQEKLMWKQDHLLEIQYDIGHIEEFRNLWCLDEVENVDVEHNPCVEVRLSPASPDFSMMTPNGSFR